MSLDDIAESIGTVEEAQTDDDDHRVHTDDDGDELHRRAMDEYDGGWSADH